MIIESISILAILLCMVVVFVRAQRIDYAISITPIMLLPAAHLFALICMRLAKYSVPFTSYRVIIAFVDIASLAVSSGLLLLFSSKIKSKRNKRLYIIMLSGYNIILTCAYVHQILYPLFA